MERISNDVWFYTFHLLTPLDFLAISHTCSFLYNLCSVTYAPIDKYWECQCKHLWSKINDTNYKAENWNKLFESMASFIDECAAYVSGMSRWRSQEITKMKKLAYNITVTVDTIANGINLRGILELAIIKDHLEIFKIYTHNMSDDILNKPFHKTTFGLPGDRYLILHHVIENDALKICQYLLDTMDDGSNKKFRDIDVSVVNPHSYPLNTPLTAAVWRKNVQIIELLINHPNMTQMELNNANSEGMTPLHHACRLTSRIDINDQIKIIRLLIDDVRTNVNYRGHKYGVTPLMTAIREHPKFVEILLQHEDINVNVQNCKGNTVLHLLAMMKPTKDSNKERAENYVKLAKLLMARDDLDCGIINDLGKTALEIAKQTKWKTMVHILNGETLQK